MRQCGYCLLSLAVVASLSCSSSEPDRSLKQVGQPIWNGSTIPASADATGVVHTAMGQGQGFGSGIALNNRWVLTAKHVRENAAIGATDYAQVHADFAGAVTYTATTGAILSLGPQDVLDQKYDLEVFRFDNPTPLKINNSTGGFLTPIFSGTTSDIIAQPVMVCWGYGQGGPAGNAGTLRFALLDPTGGSLTINGPPRSFTLAPPVNFFSSPNAQQQQVSFGDSGGPCLDNQGNLLGVIRAIQTGPQPSPVGIMTSVDAFSGLRKQLARLAATNPQFAYFGDVDFDQNPDLLMLTAKDDGTGQLFIDPQLQLSNESIVADGFLDFDSVNLLKIHIPFSAVDTAVASFGDFNGNGAQDILAFVGDETLYFDGQSGLTPVVHTDLSGDCFLDPLTCLPFLAPIATSYQSLNVADVNFDGFDDVEAVSANGLVDSYYGSVHGLTVGFPMEGFPSADGHDGKFLTLAVQPSASLGVSSYLFRVKTQHDPNVSLGELHIDIFDGDLFGSHDTVVTGGKATRTCYALYADPDQDGTGESSTPLVMKENTQFVNNAWGSMLDVPVDTGPTLEFDAAHVPGSSTEIGNRYSYLLRVFISTAPCGDPIVAPTDPIVNAIKIRANGAIDFVSSVEPINGIGGAVSIRGSDSNGAFSAPDSCTPQTCSVLYTQDVDTTYDGSWDFSISTAATADPSSPTLSDIWLADADADSTLDEVAPGNATGANAEINFKVTEITETGNVLSTLFQPSHPSGQFTSSVEPCVGYDIFPISPATELPPLLAWEWTQVLTHNNIWLSVPTTQPPKCVNAAAAGARTTSHHSTADIANLVATLPLHGGQRRFHILETTASPTEFWSSTQAGGRIATVLPVRLGEATGCGSPGLPVVSVQQALSILKAPVRLPHPDSRSSTIKQLQAELLVAKLNWTRGQQLGEDIGRAFLYGTTNRVADVVARADATLSHICSKATDARGDSDQQPSLEELTAVLRLLRSINAGSVSYWPPVDVTKPL